MTISVSVLEYMGKIAGGVLTLISIEWNSDFYDATLFYTKNQMIITPSQELELAMGCKLQDHEDHQKILEIVKDKVADYDQVYTTLEDFDLKKQLPTQ